MGSVNHVPFEYASDMRKLDVMVKMYVYILYENLGLQIIIVIVMLLFGKVNHYVQ